MRPGLSVHRHTVDLHPPCELDRNRPGSSFSDFGSLGHLKPGILVFLSVHWFGIKAEGLTAYLKHYVTPSPILLPFHLISEVSRTLALAVRLFGNVMSLEIGYALILLVAGFLVPSSAADASSGRGGHSSISVRHARVNLHRRRHSSPRTPARKGKRCNLKDINSFVTISTIVAGLGIVLGTMLPALAMGRAISKALEALAHQPEAESSITRALFVGLAMIESLSIYCLVVVLIILFRNPLIQYLHEAIRGEQHGSGTELDHLYSRTR